MTVLRVVAAHRPPFSSIDPSRPPQSQFMGLVIELLPVLFQTAGLGNYTFNFYAFPNLGGEKFSNGSWNGIMGELTHGTADIAAFPITLVPGRPADIDITYSYVSAGLGLLVRKGQVVDNPLLFLQPFDAKLWLALLGAVFVAALVQKLISLYTPFGDSDIMSIEPYSKGAVLEHGDHSAAKQFAVEKLSDSILMETWLSLFGERRGMMVGRSWATRIFGIAFAFFSVVIMAAYTANFASLLTVQLISQDINSLKDLSIRNATIAINQSGAAKEYFSHTKDPVGADVGSRRVFVNYANVGVEMVRNGTVAAYLSDAVTLQWYAGRAPCDLTVVGAGFGPGALVYGLRKNSSLTAPLNAAMLELYDNGMLDLLRRNWGPDNSQCGGPGGDLQNAALTASQFKGLFAMLAVFAGGALLWATGEHVACLLARCHPPIGRAAATLHRAAKGKELRQALSRRTSVNRNNSNIESGPLGNTVPPARAAMPSESPFGHRSLTWNDSAQHQGGPGRAVEHSIMEVALMGKGTSE